MNPQSFAQFTSRIAGEVIVPGSQAYDHVRTVFNQEGSPAVIVRGQSNQDIVTTLRFAREHHFTLSVRSGGHGLSGLATNNGGLVLDLSAFKGVELLDRGQHLQPEPEHQACRKHSGLKERLTGCA